MDNARPDPVLAAMNHPQFHDLLRRAFTPLRDSGWPVDRSVFFSPWRHTAEEFIPPFAFWTRWGGEDKLSQAQEEWLQARRVFGYVRTDPVDRNGEQFQQRTLFVFDVSPQPKPPAMYHATPTRHVAAILASGLMPGRATGVNTTQFPETHRWIHLFEAEQHATERFLLLGDNKGRVPPGSYTILRVDAAGIDELLCDPFSPHGFVTPADAILPLYITALNEVVVAG